VDDSGDFCPDWPSPQRASLNEREVHVWLIKLDDPRVDIERGQKLLSPAEKVRATRFKFQRDQRRYVVAHAGLRSILSEYINISPAALEFFSGPNGKPELTPTYGTPPIKFNLSHSHEVAIVAVTGRGEIGIDVEYVKRDFPFEEVAKRFFSAKEFAVLTALPAHLQRVAFFKCWTSKEAFLKAKGTGLSGKLDEVELVLTANQAVRVNGTIPDWTLTEITLSTDYMAAVVAAGDQDQVVCYRWNPTRLE
jgi:4'-phosphopantetheinyl transferase